MQCLNCGSTYTIKKGLVNLSNGRVKQRYKCKTCLSSFSAMTEDESIEDMFAEEDEIEYSDLPDQEMVSFQYTRSADWLQANVYSKKRVIVAAAQNNTPVNQGFLAALQTYMQANGAGLVVIPIKYKTINSEDDVLADTYDKQIEHHLCENTIEFPDYNLKIYAGLKIQATAENPLSGLDPLSKGRSIIVGHAQVQLKTLPNLDKRISDIITTTGAITNKNYSRTKLGEKARFNHSLSAIVLEFDENHYHLRHLNYDEETSSFWDIDKQYTANCIHDGNQCAALVTGDEHAIFRDPNVEKWTYSDEKSIVNVTRPWSIIRHDSFDAYSISHHHRRNQFTLYAKWKSGINSVEEELVRTIDYINKTTPDFSTSYIVQSNHNEHLLRWLNEVDIKTEPWNAKFYHHLMYLMLSNTEMTENGTSHPDPFMLVTEGHLKDNVRFVDRTGMKIMGIEVGAHGDFGVNGARGGPKSFARVPEKMIVGHSHSPSIEKGCYTVGTSSKLALEYNRGASTWHHAHVIIHPNGKRQMIFITPDGWRLD